MKLNKSFELKLLRVTLISSHVKNTLEFLNKLKKYYSRIKVLFGSKEDNFVVVVCNSNQQPLFEGNFIKIYVFPL